MQFVKNPKDFWAGILYIAFGAAAIGIAYNYPVGSAGRMGPGYFPRALGIILIGLGLILALRALRLRGEPLSFPTFKPVAIIIGATVLFGLAAPKLGLIVATILLVIVSSTASDEFRWKEAIIASIALAAFTIMAFVWGLNLQLPTWPWFVA
ncbi:MAG: tripartite tricarboxylate transporter TctB family protein [Burkholderiales bacterium]|nr:tripartite tricarboxylate transporter TctB family protein [Burkholderiales bacterium]